MRAVRVENVALCARMVVEPKKVEPSTLAKALMYVGVVSDIVIVAKLFEPEDFPHYAEDEGIIVRDNSHSKGGGASVLTWRPISLPNSSPRLVAARTAL